ncbi:MAG: TAT-variant-translocated molybdopterin oxidoreductase [Tepidisphaeraceae bacterium]
MNDQTPKTGPNGRTYWQSVSQLAETPGAETAFTGEFQNYDPEGLLSGSRRKFLKLAGASMALAGLTLTGCRRWPKENLVPQNARAVGVIPGVPEQYATVYELGGFAYPLLITTYDGRPIKVDGNPMHPSVATFGGKLGASTGIVQASLLEMYDPERSRAVVKSEKGGIVRQPVGYDVFKKFASEHFAQYKGNGEKLAVLTEQTRSPSFDAALAAFKAAYPAAKVYEYEAVSRDNEFAANKAAFGKPVRQSLSLKKAKTIVSFDADLFGSHPNSIRHVNDWAQNRKSADTTKSMNRMFVIESRYSVTGGAADERLPASVREIEQLVLQLGYKAGVIASGQAGLSPEQVKYVDTLWEDLQKSGAESVVVGGYTLRPEVLHVIAAVNEKLGAFGSTITLLPDTDRPTHVEAIKSLIDALNTGNVNTLVIIGGNPVYDAPADLGFDSAIGKGSITKIRLGLYEDETSHKSDWHVNRAHYLESWADATMFDGSVGVQQPTIEPLFGGKTPAEFLSLLAGDDVSAQNLLYRVWGKRLNEAFVANSQAFKKILHDGFVPGTPEALTGLKVSTPSVGFEPAGAEGTFELRFAPDYKTYDGRFANNGWLQELPDPITKITWDNVAQISYADALKLGVKQRDHSEDVLSIEVGGQTLEIPAYVVPGQPSGVITLHLGYARQKAGAALLSERYGTIGADVGYNTYKLRTSRNMWSVTGAKVTNTGKRADVASTQGHHIIEPLGEEVRTVRIGEKSQPGMIVHESTLAAYAKDPHAPHSKAHKLLPLQLFPEPYKTDPKYPGGPVAFNEPHAWGMTIDMNACTGCQACVVACQAENNIPVVGKDQVIQTRAMHWLRIDRYFKGAIDDPNPQVTNQPMMCVHCENAPCEQVCPVAATVHDSEGLNTMVYNRCIGTRYCANNCPYKVRRFNYLDYQSRNPGETLKPYLGIPDQELNNVDKIKALSFNPDVSVRMRGVMEKCTYCVQRIKSVTNHRRIEFLDGKRAKVTVDDFDVVTACQSACAAEAIVFGDLNDPNSLVSQQQRGGRAYQVLQELNNRPRTHHLAKLRNPVHEPVASANESH